MPFSEDREQHHRRHLAGHLGGVVQRAARQRAVGPRDLAHGGARGGDQLRRRRGWARSPRPAPTRRVQPSSAARRSARVLGLLQHRGQRCPRRAGAGRPACRAARHGGHDARRAVDPADGADAVVAQGDLAQLERRARRGQEGVAALADRRRAGVRGLAGERRAVALDADRAEHRADRAGPRPPAPGPARCAAPGRRARPSSRAPASWARSRSTPCSRTTSSRRRPSASFRSRTRSGSSVPHDRGGAEQAAAEARALLVGPVDQRDRARRRAARGRARAAPRAPP